MTWTGPLVHGTRPCARLTRLTLTMWLTLLALPAFAQRAVPDAPDATEFMSRSDFWMSAAPLASGDNRFSWDTHWGGDVDVVDYVHGRLSVLTEYQAILGSEFRSFDPNQGIYTLEASGSVRYGRTEVALVYSHVSRHLSDRPKRFAIAENSLGPRVLRRFGAGETTTDLRAGWLKVVNASYVDYTWIGQVDVTVRHALSSHTSVYGRGFGEVYGIDPTVAGRGRQEGGRAEVGVRLSGTHGAVELFAGAERVVDADPLDRVARHWAFAGFRFVNK